MQYRLYHMNALSGHVEGVEDLVAADDAAAFNAILQHRGDRPLELWCENRKVGRVEARDLTQEMLDRRQWERALRDAEKQSQHG